MKSILVLVLALFLTACEPGYRGLGDTFPVVPSELSDCHFFRIDGTKGPSITVVRCPNSTTTTQTLDKSQTTTVVIDGVEYVRK